MSNQDLEEAQYKRFMQAKYEVAARLLELAEQVNGIKDTDHLGRKREMSEMVGQVTHTLLWGVANLGLDRMASWASAVYEIRAYDAAHPETPPAQCDYSTTDPDRHCVLDRDHTLPYNGGIEHVSSDGEQFV